MEDVQKAKEDQGRKQAAAEEIYNLYSFEGAVRAGTEVGWQWTSWANMTAEEQQDHIRMVEDFQNEEWAPLA